MKYKPVGYKLVLSFLDKEEEEEKPGTSYSGMNQTAPMKNKAVLAEVLGVGSEVKGVKTGDLVFVHSYARSQGVELGDDEYVVESYCLIAIVLKK